MSVRYIWGKYTPELRYSYMYDQVDSPYHLGAFTASQYRMYGLTDQPSRNSRTGILTYTGTYVCYGGNSTSYIDTDTYQYLLYQKASDDPNFEGSTTTNTSGTTGTLKFKPVGTYSWLFNRRWTNTNWHRTVSSSDVYMNCYNNSHNETYDMTLMNLETYYADGDFISWVTSASASSYPSWDVSGSYFYESEENDIIDPDAVILPELILNNDTIQISLTESSGAMANKYGTITYQYQYKFGSGQWTDIATTSDLTQSLHISSDATSVQVRVRAQDNLGFISNDYVMSAEVPVYASQPPTAPGSISVNRVVAGWETTVTITPSTDPDGTISYYVFERRVNDGGWTSVQSSTSLTYSETIDSSWNKVAYRAKAVDNSGTPSPYVTSDDYDILTDVIVIMGPSKTDFGNKLGKFNFTVSVLLAGTPTSNDVNLRIRLDDTSDLYNSTVQTDEDITVAINTGELTKAAHTILVTASKEGYSTEQKTYTFTIPGLTLPEDGNVVTFQDSKGKDVIPKSIAQAILMNDGRNLEDVIKQILAKLPE